LKRARNEAPVGTPPSRRARRSSMTRERKRGGRAAEPATDDEDGVPGGQFTLVFVFRLSAVGWKSFSRSTRLRTLMTAISNHEPVDSDRGTFGLVLRCECGNIQRAFMSKLQTIKGDWSEHERSRLDRIRAEALGVRRSSAVIPTSAIPGASYTTASAIRLSCTSLGSIAAIR
jgi:hypothetical protein